MASYCKYGALLLILVTFSTAAIFEAPPQNVLNDSVSKPENASVKASSITPKVVYDTAKNYALPKNVYPASYEIELSPVFDEPTVVDDRFKFSGSVKIVVNIMIKTKKIVMNIQQLKVDQCTLTSVGKDIPVIKSDDEATETLTLDADTELAVGKQYTVECTFKGTLNHPDFKGFYLSKYQIGAKTEYLATTQFESSGARRAFPCFDEPGFKATFQVTINHNKKYNTVLSNTGLDSSVSTLTKAIFKKTPVMSTYLLAFIVSTFEVYKDDKKDPAMKVYANKNLIVHAEQSQEFGRAAIEAMEEYLNLKYSDHVEKLDQVAIPDFAAGAMENWGLVTYREAQFLFNPEESTALNLRSIYCTITHEFAHQWFGNLVTPAWWKYIWLNEGFATYFEYMATDLALKKLPEKFKSNPWKVDELFAVLNRHKAFTADCVNSTRPMSYPAETPQEVNSLFDSIAYAKSGSVLYMLEHILTTKVWKNGLNNYLKKKALGYVEPKDLWDSLQEAYDTEYLQSPQTLAELGHISVNDIGNSWSLESGYPVVTVYKSDSAVKLAQTRFQTDFKNNAPTKWIIPVNYALESTLVEDLKKTQPTQFLWRGSQNFTVDKKDDFILINNQQTGYYRVNYDDNNWERINKFLNDSNNLAKITPVTHAQLVDDALNLARGGYLKYSSALSTLRSLTGAKEFAPWQAAITNLKFLDIQLRGSNIEKHFKKFNKDIVSKIYNEIVNNYQETEKDDQLLKLNRLNILKRACDVGLEDCLTKAADILQKQYLDPAKKMIPNIQTALYCGGVRTGKTELAENLLKRYNGLTSKVEKKNLLQGLGCLEDKDALNKVLDEVLKEKSKIEDPTTVYTGMIEGGTTGLEVALNNFGEHYTHLLGMIGEANISTIISSFSNHISTESHLKQLTKLTDTVKEEITAPFQTAIQKINEKIEWNKVYLAEIEDWLKQNGYNSASGVMASVTLLVSTFLLTIFTRL